MKLNKQEQELLQEVITHIDALFTISDRVGLSEWKNLTVRELKERMVLFGTTFEKFVETINAAEIRG